MERAANSKRNFFLKRKRYSLVLLIFFSLENRTRDDVPTGVFASQSVTMRTVSSTYGKQKNKFDDCVQLLAITTAGKHSKHGQPPSHGKNAYARHALSLE